MTDIERIMTIFGQCYNLLNNNIRYPHTTAEIRFFFNLRAREVRGELIHVVEWQGVQTRVFCGCGMIK